MFDLLLDGQHEAICEIAARYRTLYLYLYLGDRGSACLRICVDDKCAPADTREPGQFTRQTLSQRFRDTARRPARFGDRIWCR